MELLLITLAVLVAISLLGGLFCKLVFGWTWKKYFGSFWSWW